jgi:5-carboxymethyl-2-hydroxymuconate isomerase
MPHIILETTSDVVENQDIVDILEVLVAKLSSFESISPASIKAYHSLRHTWQIGEGGPHGFIHCEVAILSGRPEELVQTITDGMYQSLIEAFERSHQSGEAGITLELRQMDKATYRK